jgi:hypothetical protein
MNDSKDPKAAEKAVEEETVEKPPVVETQKTLPSRSLFTILSGMVKGGRPARVTLGVTGAADGKLTVSALTDEGEVMGKYEITEAGVKPL